LFNDLAVDGYFLEYDDERSGDFSPLRLMPKGKIVVLGLVTTKVGELESKDIKRRIDEAAVRTARAVVPFAPMRVLEHGARQRIAGNRRRPSFGWWWRPRGRCGA
jgi:5-methyltetrahydropteroyltriglutamate--homocysteine methyltransferase